MALLQSNSQAFNNWVQNGVFKQPDEGCNKFRRIANNSFCEIGSPKKKMKVSFRPKSEKENGPCIDQKYLKLI